MDLKNYLSFILNLDKYVGIIITQYGAITYLILFFLIFLETGLVITPFLPGDSLIFILGTFASQQVINFWLLLIVLISAAILGDSVNYFIGKNFGEKVFSKSGLYNQQYIEKTKEFYAKYGGKTIIYARFVPFVRTFAPFIAGIGHMKYRKFFIYNVIGGVLWVSLFLVAGYFFGAIPFVKQNLTLITFIIIGLSLVPPLIEYLIEKRKRPKYLKITLNNQQ